jgi:hypothetical protein
VAQRSATNDLIFRRANARCMNHGQRRSAEVGWLLFWPPLACELGRTQGREREEGLCSVCVASLADGQRHRRRSDDTWWQLLPEDHIPPSRSRRSHR